jgi:hypothetical protein
MASEQERNPIVPNATLMVAREKTYKPEDQVIPSFNIRNHNAVMFIPPYRIPYNDGQNPPYNERDKPVALMTPQYVLIERTIEAMDRSMLNMLAFQETPIHQHNPVMRILIRRTIESIKKVKKTYKKILKQYRSGQTLHGYALWMQTRERVNSVQQWQRLNSRVIAYANFLMSTPRRV